MNYNQPLINNTRSVILTLRQQKIASNNYLIGHLHNNVLTKFMDPHPQIHN